MPPRIVWKQHNDMTLERLDIHSCDDKLQVALHRARYDFALRCLQPNDAVLEIGAGLGVFTEELCSCCSSYTGVEYDEAACRAARERTHADIIRADARHLPLPDNQYSYIVCLEVLEHLGDWQAGVRHIHRCLRPQGRALISVPWRKQGGKSQVNEHHLYEPGEQELILLLGTLFKEVRVFYQYFLETPLMTLARKLHLRRLLGLATLYSDLSRGLPAATNRLRIGPSASGMKLGLFVVASQKR